MEPQLLEAPNFAHLGEFSRFKFSSGDLSLDGMMLKPWGASTASLHAVFKNHAGWLLALVMIRDKPLAVRRVSFVTATVVKKDIKYFRFL